MTMVSFRISEKTAELAAAWARRLGIRRSDVFRNALTQHLLALAAEDDIERWRAMPLEETETDLVDIADWGPAEDWTDW